MEEHEQDEDYREEVFTRVMGPDAHGPVRMYGTELHLKYFIKVQDLPMLMRTPYEKSEVSSKLHLVMTHIGFHVNTTPSGSGQAPNISSHLQETYGSNEQQPQLDSEA
ncbi:hypothetical protein C1H46_014921 [Malus baccata]|uniref:Uncharacterized protein n=1 Tax=Malus baccata TaxID=106549 RepID=A0A540MKY6_MALBA|nr:hypothetical protein C1H46_014921 [Malus baccata]